MSINISRVKKGRKQLSKPALDTILAEAGKPVTDDVKNSVIKAELHSLRGRCIAHIYRAKKTNQTPNELAVFIKDNWNDMNTVVKRVYAMSDKEIENFENTTGISLYAFYWFKYGFTVKC